MPYICICQILRIMYIMLNRLVEYLAGKSVLFLYRINDPPVYGWYQLAVGRGVPSSADSVVDNSLLTALVERFNE